MAEQDNPQRQAITIKVPEEVAAGVYANNMIVGHTKEEFLMDFIYMAPGQGIVTARVITSPGHMKRIIRALIENMQKYEARYGEIKAAKDPKEEMLIN